MKKIKLRLSFFPYIINSKKLFKKPEFKFDIFLKTNNKTNKAKSIQSIKKAKFILSVGNDELSYTVKDFKEQNSFSNIYHNSINADFRKTDFQNLLNIRLFEDIAQDNNNFFFYIKL